jgi:catechol 2,3-dioxygenase-like lactoylglutathione lyase family enzyme
MIRTTGLDQSVLQVNDVEHSTRFYTEILGMPEYTEDKGRISSCTPFSRALSGPLHLFSRSRRVPFAADRVRIAVAAREYAKVFVWHGSTF